MSRIDNPRFPHHCRIIRYADTEPLEDQSDILDPLVDEEDLLSDDDAEPSEQSEESGEQDVLAKVIYDGVCRSDNRDTISDNGDVIASYRTLSLPIKQQEWTEDTVPREGDKIELQRYGYTEYGLVIDRRPSNLGTHLLWKYDRN